MEYFINPSGLIGEHHVTLACHVLTTHYNYFISGLLSKCLVTVILSIALYDLAVLYKHTVNKNQLFCA